MLRAHQRLTFLVLLTVAPATVLAQSSSDFAGYAGLSLTPVGAFAPVITGTLPAPSSRPAFQLRTSTYSFDGGEDRTINVGVGAVVGFGKARTTFELGYAGNTQCGDCGIYMVGADVQVPLLQPANAESGLSVALNPAVGVGKPTEGGGTLYAAALSVPLSATITTASKLSVVPYVSPGFGLGGASADGESESGTRPMIAAGVTFGKSTSPAVVTAGVRKIFIEDSPMVYALGFAFRR
jgi:hypothetical protein